VKTRLALAGLGLLLAGTAPGAVADGEDLLVERINVNIGCNQEAGTPTCATTQYWLGTGVGTNSVGQNGAITPLDWATHNESGEYRTTVFAGDRTLQDAYVLRGGSTITGQISSGGYLGGAEASVDSGVFVRLSGSVPRDDNPTRKRAVELGSAEVTKMVVTPEDTVYSFSFKVPQELDGKPVSGLTADIGQRHLTVLQNGFIDGEGGSFFLLPHVDPAE
jgi:hypothetical protein